MKRLKKLFISLMAIVMLLTCTLSLAGCGEDIKKLELKFQVYNYEDEVMETHTMHIDLYRHLAPNTVDKIISYVNKGYYNNNVIYVMSEFSNQIMFGDLVFKNGEIEQNEIKPQIDGEFKYGGTVGSNLTNQKGSIGLWRTWYAFEGQEGYRSSNAAGTGRATWYMPTESISNYNDYFCVFAQYDVDDKDNKNAMNMLMSAFEGGNYQSYVVYYTGEYDATKPNNNYGLEFNIMLQDDYWEVEDVLDVFEADATADPAQVAQYNPTTIRVPFANGDFSAKIIGAKIV